jgi:hypothetical protein
MLFSKIKKQNYRVALTLLVWFISIFLFVGGILQVNFHTKFYLTEIGEFIDGISYYILFFLYYAIIITTLYLIIYWVYRKIKQL